MHREDGAHDERTARAPRRRRPGRDRRAGEAVAEEVMERATRLSVRNGAISMLVAAAVLGVFNSGGLRTWARGLPGNAATDLLVEAADRWHATMRRAGLTAAMTAVQHAVATFRDQGWPGGDILSGRTADIVSEDRAKAGHPRGGGR